MRVFHIAGDQFTELKTLPERLPATGFIWIGYGRIEFEAQVAQIVQAALHRWDLGPLVDLHVSDLINNQLPSHFDYTSWCFAGWLRCPAVSSPPPNRIRSAWLQQKRC
jgi:magnesium transporter